VGTLLCAHSNTRRATFRQVILVSADFFPAQIIARLKTGWTNAFHSRFVAASGAWLLGALKKFPIPEFELSAFRTLIAQKENSVRA
jgi:hypothetical protein